MRRSGKMKEKEATQKNVNIYIHTMYTHTHTHTHTHIPCTYTCILQDLYGPPKGEEHRGLQDKHDVQFNPPPPPHTHTTVVRTR